MSYTIEFSLKAAKLFKELPKSVKNQLSPNIDNLAENPRPSGVKKLKERKNYYRIRVGDYRIIYQINDKTLFILIAKIGHRKDVYSGI